MTSFQDKGDLAIRLAHILHVQHACNELFESHTCEVPTVGGVLRVCVKVDALRGALLRSVEAGTSLREHAVTAAGTKLGHPKEFNGFLRAWAEGDICAMKLGIASKSSKQNWLCLHFPELQEAQVQQANPVRAASRAPQQENFPSWLTAETLAARLKLLPQKVRRIPACLLQSHTLLIDKIFLQREPIKQETTTTLQRRRKLDQTCSNGQVSAVIPAIRVQWEEM